MYLIVFLISFVSSWSYLSYRVYQNTPDFQPDEMYWIGTARIIPLLLSGNTTDPFWKEYYGYANYNGAKLIYGLSLGSMGYKAQDFAFIDYPPNTYYQFSTIVGRYPQNSPHYTILRDARMVHALFASLSVGLFAILALLLFGDILTAFLSAFVLIVHPIFQSVATIAFADAFLLFFELSYLVLIELYFSVSRPITRIILVLVLGINIAVITAIQPYGIVFSALILLYVVLKHNPSTIKNRIDTGGVFLDLFLFLLSGSVTFAFLHPNFFFTKAMGPFEVITSRIRITRYHMMYYRQTLPSRVLSTIPERIFASFNYLFQGSLVGLLSALSSIVLLLRSFRVPYEQELSRLVISACFLYGVSIFLLIFNESRLLLPLLPFLILFSVYIFAAASKVRSETPS
jgi:hypothetical protein